MSMILRLTNGGASPTKIIQVSTGVGPQQNTTPLAPGASCDFTIPTPAGRTVGGQAVANLDDGSAIKTGPLQLVDGETLPATLQ